MAMQNIFVPFPIPTNRNTNFRNCNLSKPMSMQTLFMRMEMFGNFVHCESTTVSQRPLLDHDDIHALRKSVFTKLSRNQHKPHQE